MKITKNNAKRLKLIGKGLLILSCFIVIFHIIAFLTLSEEDATLLDEAIIQNKEIDYIVSSNFYNYTTSIQFFLPFTFISGIIFYCLGRFIKTKKILENKTREEPYNSATKFSLIVTVIGVFYGFVILPIVVVIQNDINPDLMFAPMNKIDSEVLESFVRTDLGSLMAFPSFPLMLSIGIPLALKETMKKRKTTIRQAIVVSGITYFGLVIPMYGIQGWFHFSNYSVDLRLWVTFFIGLIAILFFLLPYLIVKISTRNHHVYISKKIYLKTLLYYGTFSMSTLIIYIPGVIQDVDQHRMSISLGIWFVSLLFQAFLIWYWASKYHKSGLEDFDHLKIQKNEPQLKNNTDPPEIEKPTNIHSKKCPYCNRRLIDFKGARKCNNCGNLVE